MVPHVKGQMVDQAFLLLGRAPGSAEEAVQVCPKHRAGMVEREQRIKPDFFQLPLSYDASTTSGRRSVSGLGMMLKQISGVVRILV